MKVTFYAPYAAWSPHFETDLELTEQHLERGDDVTMITCDAALRYCEANQERQFSTCARCMGRAQEGLKRLSRPIKVLKLSELMLDAKTPLKALWQLPRTFASAAQLSQLKVDGFDLGAGVYSSMISRLVDPSPDPSVHPELTWDILSSAFAAYTALDLYLEKNACDLFYLMHGRLANFRAALRACQKHQVRCLVHDRGADHNSYALAENTMLEDPAHVVKDVKETLARAKSPEEKLAVAREFYAEREDGKIANWVSVIDGQVRGSLPDGWLDNPIRIVMFSSTESEFKSCQDFYPAEFYPSQIEGLEMILGDLAGQGFSGSFAVRIHPYAANTKSDYTDRLRALNYPFLRIIGPEENVDSYALLMTAQKVLTFGSTMGIEAAYRRVPSISLRWTPYTDLGSTYNPTSHAEVINLLLRPLDPKPIDGAIDFGFYAKTFGNRLNYVTPDGAFFALFKGVAIWPGYPYNGFFSDEPTRAAKWRRALWTAWNKQRLQAIYHGRKFRPDPIKGLETRVKTAST
jgi:hypothetical protein